VASLRCLRARTHTALLPTLSCGSRAGPPPCLSVEAGRPSRCAVALAAALAAAARTAPLRCTALHGGLHSRQAGPSGRLCAFILAGQTCRRSRQCSTSSCAPTAR